MLIYIAEIINKGCTQKSVIEMGADTGIEGGSAEGTPSEDPRMCYYKANVIFTFFILFYCYVN